MYDFVSSSANKKWHCVAQPTRKRTNGIGIRAKEQQQSVTAGRRRIWCSNFHLINWPCLALFSGPRGVFFCAAHVFLLHFSVISHVHTGQHFHLMFNGVACECFILPFVGNMFSNNVVDVFLFSCVFHSLVAPSQMKMMMQSVL